MGVALIWRLHPRVTVVQNLAPRVHDGGIRDILPLVLYSGRKWRHAVWTKCSIILKTQGLFSFPEK